MLLAAALATAALFQVNPAPPAVTVGAADGITTSAATVHGTVNPNGVATSYHVEYGTSSGYGLQTTDQDAGSGTDAAAVSVALSKLTSDTTYHYALVATNAAGVTRSTDHTLHTAITPRAPVASSRPATAIGPLNATLVGAITPRGLATTVHFVYGTTTSYGSTTADQAAGAGSSPVTVRTAISGLQPNTRYHFRAVATNALGHGARRRPFVHHGQGADGGDDHAVDLPRRLGQRPAAHGRGDRDRLRAGGAGEARLPVRRRLDADRHRHRGEQRRLRVQRPAAVHHRPAARAHAHGDRGRQRARRRSTWPRRWGSARRA